METSEERSEAEAPYERAFEIDGFAYYRDEHHGTAEQCLASPSAPVDLRVRFRGAALERELGSEEYALRMGVPGDVPRVEGPAERGRRYIRAALSEGSRMSIHHHGGFWAQGVLEATPLPFEITYRRPAEPAEELPEGAVD